MYERRKRCVFGVIYVLNKADEDFVLNEFEQEAPKRELALAELPIAAGLKETRDEDEELRKCLGHY